MYGNSIIYVKAIEADPELKLNQEIIHIINNNLSVEIPSFKKSIAIFVGGNVIDDPESSRASLPLI